MIGALFSWLKLAWWHWPVAYLGGFAAFVIVAILLWGFIYRPNACTGHDFPMRAGEPWNAEEVTMYAFLQGFFWPFVLAFYGVYIPLKLLIIGLAQFVNLCELIATKAAHSIPNKRPHGFQMQHLDFVNSALSEPKLELPRVSSLGNANADNH